MPPPRAATVPAVGLYQLQGTEDKTSAWGRELEGLADSSRRSLSRKRTLRPAGCARCVGWGRLEKPLPAHLGGPAGVPTGELCEPHSFVKGFDENPDPTQNTGYPSPELGTVFQGQQGTVDDRHQSKELPDAPYCGDHDEILQNER